MSRVLKYVVVDNSERCLFLAQWNYIHDTREIHISPMLDRNWPLAVSLKFEHTCITVRKSSLLSLVPSNSPPQFGFKHSNHLISYNTIESY